MNNFVNNKNRKKEENVKYAKDNKENNELEILTS